MSKKAWHNCSKQEICDGREICGCVRESVRFPSREFLINQAWGDVPVSYIQGYEDLDACGFLDLKINKWEIGDKWSGRGRIEPSVRIIILKENNIKDYALKEGWSLPLGLPCETFIVFELDEGAEEIDDILLLRLVSVFFDMGTIYVLRDGLKEMSEQEISAVPSQDAVLARLAAGQ